MSAISEAFPFRRDTPSVCLWKENPNRLVSLWEILEEFSADTCIAVVSTMVRLEHEALAAEPRSVLTHRVRGEAKIILQGIVVLATAAGLDETLTLAQFTARKLSESTMVEDLKFTFATLRAVMQSEMHKQLFLSVPFHLKNRYKNEKPMGQEVYDSFPSARRNLTEAGSCLACGLNNASMHHLLLATEIGLRELGRDRQIKYAVSGDIDFRQWGEIIRELETAVDAIRQWPKSHLRDEAHRFYNAALFELRSFNNGWRQHLAHARDHVFSDKDALALWDHVAQFLIGLSARISEDRHTDLIWGSTCT